jgi:hypothetical protein
LLVELSKQLSRTGGQRNPADGRSRTNRPPVP